MSMQRYQDILPLARPASAHPPMGALERAAQFAPFAALTGYDAAIQEEARLVDSQIAPGEEALRALDKKIRLLIRHVGEGPQVSVTYFLPDERKQGGAYTVSAGQVKKIRTFERQMLLTDGTLIPLDAVLRLESPLFDREEDAD